jgi:hypothetical protein
MCIGSQCQLVHHLRIILAISSADSTIANQQKVLKIGQKTKKMGQKRVGNFALTKESPNN